MALSTHIQTWYPVLLKCYNCYLNVTIFFTLESLIGILEAIGAHSVTSRELKQMIGLFTPLDNGAQVVICCTKIKKFIVILICFNLVPMGIFGGGTSC